jgi:hypothetical protein
MQESRTQLNSNYTWRNDRCKLEKSYGDNKTMKIRPLGFTCILPVDIELYLARWIEFLRSDGIPVSNTVVQLRAKSLSEEFGISDDMFKARIKYDELVC